MISVAVLLWEKKKRDFLSDTSQEWCVAFYIPSVQSGHQFLNSQPSKHQWYPVSLFHSRFLSLRPSTRKHYNYFLFLVGIGHGTSVNNNHSLWTSLYLYISDSITIGTIEVYFIFIPVLLVLFSPRGKIK